MQSQEDDRHVFIDSLEMSNLELIRNNSGSRRWFLHGNIQRCITVVNIRSKMNVTMRINPDRSV
jgi:hypothetical protein